MGAMGPDAAPPPTLRSYGIFTLAALHVVVGSGAVYGWTALRPLLRDAGYFAGNEDAFDGEQQPHPLGFGGLGFRV